ncbi:MAG: hypothetical protein JXR19_05795 [Bacteroidia bacterium]
MQFINFIIAIIFCIAQQAFLILMGVVVYYQGPLFLAIIFWSLCLPMLKVNRLTIRYMMRFGFINFITMNADTSQIDVKKGERWYDK